jgi:hypothetical protein
MADIDYEALLRKYIQHVYVCEGSTFIGSTWFSVPKDFTFEEACVLNRLSEEAVSAYEAERSKPRSTLRGLITPEVMTTYTESNSNE